MASSVPDFHVPMYPEDLEVEQFGGHRFWLEGPLPDLASADADADALLDGACSLPSHEEAAAAAALPPPVSTSPHAQMWALRSPRRRCCAAQC